MTAFTPLYLAGLVQSRSDVLTSAVCRCASSSITVRAILSPSPSLRLLLSFAALGHFLQGTLHSLPYLTVLSCLFTLQVVTASHTLSCPWSCVAIKSSQSQLDSLTAQSSQVIHRSSPRPERFSISTSPLPGPSIAKPPSLNVECTMNYVPALGWVSSDNTANIACITQTR